MSIQLTLEQVEVGVRGADLPLHPCAITDMHVTSDSPKT